ncbi:MAG: CBS domain-containing protein [Desulfovibrionaceae bacterium]|nr:CBS domain-containing protein [Desulfovibrionaceae bacterium]
MLILDWMQNNVIAIKPKTRLLECRRLLRENKIGRLPVVDASGIVVGVLSASDIKACMPAQDTGLQVLEALDILAETQAREIMTIPAVTISYKSTVTQAAMLMIEKSVTSLPVVDEEGHLKGILTQWDVFKGLTHMSGAQVMRNAVEVGFTVENRPGTLRSILEQIEGVHIATVLSAIDRDGRRQVEIIFWSADPAKEDAALDRLKGHPCLRYWARGSESYVNMEIVGSQPQKK